MIIICGLPGTGKTTLCKRLQNELNFKYISDWDIFNQNNIVIDNMQNKLEISKSYSHLIFDFIKSNRDEKIVIDLEYSVSPEDFNNSDICEVADIIFLGFIETSENILFDLFYKSSSNKDIDEMQLKNKVRFYKKMSELYYSQCNKYNLKFIDINRDRNQIIDSIVSDIKSNL